PELVMVFGVHHRNIGVGQRDGGERHEARVVDDVHPFHLRQLPRDWIGGLRAGDQPEAGVLGLPGRALAAGPGAELLGLVVVAGPLLAVERDRRLRTKLRRARPPAWARSRRDPLWRQRAKRALRKRYGVAAGRLRPGLAVLVATAPWHRNRAGDTGRPKNCIENSVIM